MRVPVEVLAPQTHLFQQVDHAGRQLSAGRFPMHLERAAHDVLHQVAGIERSERFLEHHLAVAPIVVPRRTRHVIDSMRRCQLLEPGLLLGRARGGRDGEHRVEGLPPVGGEPEVHPAARRVGQPAHAPTQRGLATAALADETERLAPTEVEADPVDGADMADDTLQRTLPDRKVLLQTPHRQDVVAVRQTRGAIGSPAAIHRTLRAKLGVSPSAAEALWMKHAAS